MKEKVLKVCDKVIEIGFYLLIFLVPLILTPWNYELFEYNKMMLTYGLTTIITSAWVIKMVLNKEFKIARTPLDIFLLLFLLSQILSTIFSIDFHTSLYGYYSRFHGGLFSTITYLLLYYALVSNLNNKKKIFNLIYAGLFSGLLVSIYGIMEHFGIDAQYWVQDVKNRVFSTLGQPNWLAAYLNILILITLGLIFTTKNKLKISIFYLLTSIFYVCLLYTKSRSSFVALLVGLAIFTFILLVKALIKKAFKETIKLLASSFLLIIFITFFIQPPFFNLDKFGYSQVQNLILGKKVAKISAPLITTPQGPQGPALETGGTESGAIRAIVWQGALDIALHYPLFGSGVETFAYSYYQFRPVSHNLVSEWDFLYNKAHNEFLNYAATTGFVGLGAYLSVIFFFIYFVVRQMAGIKKKKLENDLRYQNLISNFPILASLLGAFLTILITNFFGFSVVLVAIYFWLIPAFAFILLDKVNPANAFYFDLKKGPLTKEITAPEKKKKIKKNIINNSSISTLQIAATIIITLIGLLNLIQLYRFWLADTKYALAFNYDKINSYLTAYPLLKEAISLNSGEPVYYDELSYNASGLAALAFAQKQTQTANNLLNEAITTSSTAIRISPKNVNFWKTRTKMYYVLSTINEKYNYEALQALLTAKELAPTDAKIYYNLAILYARIGQGQKAIETLKETIKLKDNYRDAYYALGLILADSNQKKEAAKVFEDLLVKFATDDAQIKAKIAEWSR